MASIDLSVDVELDNFSNTEILNELNYRLKSFIDDDLKLLRNILHVHKNKIQVGFDITQKTHSINNQIKLEKFLEKLDVIDLNQLEYFLTTQK